jgi:lipid A 3-O-deacylase
MRRFVASLALAALPASVASAEIVEEVRVGVMQHNVCVTDCDNANKEDGPDLNGEAVLPRRNC